MSAGGGAGACSALEPKERLNPRPMLMFRCNGSGDFFRFLGLVYEAAMSSSDLGVREIILPGPKCNV